MPGTTQAKTAEKPQNQALEAIEGKTTCSVEETMPLLGVSRGVAYMAVRDGTIPAIRVGGRWLVLVDPLLKKLGVRS